MTNEDLRVMVENTAQIAKESGQYVEINSRLPTVLVHRGEDDEFFFQGDEAQTLLDEIEETLAEVEVSDEDFILYQAQGW